jgi:hypothetical protein
MRCEAGALDRGVQRSPAEHMNKEQAMTMTDHDHTATFEVVSGDELCAIDGGSFWCPVDPVPVLLKEFPPPPVCDPMV